jgi:two-component system chemotaxis response regulator CheB
MHLRADFSLHDIVVIGGSAGSFDVIKGVMKSLPVDLPASLLIVAHIDPSVSLMNILGDSSSLPIKTATTGESLQRGQVYLAVQDAHLILHGHHLLVRRGPHENFARPAIDPLFRSAACAFGGRVIGVLLSGGLNDGAAGLAAIKRCGGLAVIQDPTDAQVPSMPESALRAVKVDYCVPASELADLLNRLVREPAAASPPVPAELQLEVAVAAREAAGMEIDEQLGSKSPFTCPECDGVLWQMNDQQVLRFRCHVGHAVTAEAMLDAKNKSADAILWRLLRTHEERAAIAKKLASDAFDRQRNSAAKTFARRAAGYEEDANIVRDILSRVRAVTDN